MGKKSGLFFTPGIGYSNFLLLKDCLSRHCLGIVIHVIDAPVIAFSVVLASSALPGNPPPTSAGS